MDGVVRTRVGYAGGSKPGPTYRAMGDHTESIEIVYDPQRVSYEQLLDVFWSAHRPVSKPWSVQYRSAVFPADEAQRAAAEKSKLAREAQLGKPLFTAIEDDAVFWSAETYHQKYRLQGNSDIMAEIAAMYPGEDAFVGSTAAARINGYLAGHRDAGTEDTLKQLGLSDEQLTALRSRLER